MTRLPSGLGAHERQAPPGAPPAGRPFATHVLVDGTAHAFGARGLALGTAPPDGVRGLALGDDTAGIARHHCTLQAETGEAVVEDHSHGATLVNGKRVSGRTALRAGDRLRLGSLELTLIAVED